MLRNRRMDVSVSGVAQFITNRGLDELNWLEMVMIPYKNGIICILIGLLYHQSKLLQLNQVELFHY